MEYKSRLDELAERCSKKKWYFRKEIPVDKITSDGIKHYCSLGNILNGESCPSQEGVYVRIGKDEKGFPTHNEFYKCNSAKKIK